MQSNIPIPKKRFKYQFGKMNIGDSFLGKRLAVSAAYNYAPNHPLVKFVTRREGVDADGNPQYRIWRIA